MIHRCLKYIWYVSNVRRNILILVCTENRKQWVFCIRVFFYGFRVYRRNYLPLRTEMISLDTKNSKYYSIVYIDKVNSSIFSFVECS